MIAEKLATIWTKLQNTHWTWHSTEILPSIYQYCGESNRLTLYPQLPLLSFGIYSQIPARSGCSIISAYSIQIHRISSWANCSLFSCICFGSLPHMSPHVNSAHALWFMSIIPSTSISNRFSYMRNNWFPVDFLRYLVPLYLCIVLGSLVHFAHMADSTTWPTNMPRMCKLQK